MAEFYSTSSVGWTPVGAEYFNSDRGCIDQNALSGDGTFVTNPTLSGIRDVAINHETIFYLTDKKLNNELFTNTREITGFGLSSLPLSAETLTIGTSGSSTFVDYYYCNVNNPQFNKTVDLNNKEYGVKMNFVLFSPFKTNSRTYKVDPSDPFSDDITTYKFNFLSLKNVMTPNYEYDSLQNSSIRDYNKLLIGRNQKNGFYNMFLTYKANTTEFTFPPNETTYFHYPYTATSVDLSASNLKDRGAKPGDSPMNSDIIAVDQYGYYKSNSSGDNQTNNGEFLCAWLSGSNDCSCDSVWMERWYDPDTVTDGTAYITSVNGGSSCSDIWDVPATMSLEPNIRYYYDRYGKDRNEVNVSSLDSDKILHYSSWNTTIVDSTTGNDGYIIPNYSGPESHLELDGSNHAHIPPTDELLQQNEISVAINAYKEDWCCGNHSQLAGNYHYGGWGIFHNAGMPNKLLTIGDDLGNVFSFNINGTRIFEKYTDNNYKLKDINVDWVSTDLDGARWLLDSSNNKIIKLDVDDLFVKIINIPKSYIIDKLQIDTNNNLLFLDRKNNKVFKHDEDGNYLEAITAPTSASNFEVDSNDNLIYSEGSLMAVNSNGDVYIGWGSNLYKNGTVIFNFNSPLMDIKLDSEDNIWATYDGNHIAKIGSDDGLIFNKKLFSFLGDENNSRIGLTRITNANGCDENRIWIIFCDNRYMVEINPFGVVMSSINTSDLIITKSCENYTLKAKGDFTGYDVYRKFEVANGSNISPTNPALTLKVKFEDICENKTFKYINIPTCKLSKGWHNFGFTYSRRSGKLRFFIDGVIAGEESLDPSKWKISYNGTTPFILGGMSGKLGSENEERSIIDDQYFIGRLDDFRIYNKEITPFFFRSIYDLTFNDFENLIWNIDIGEKYYVEKVERFFMNKKPGNTSKYFNIKLKGLDISRDLKLLIEDSIRGSIKNLIPEHTELNSVVWS